MKALLNYRKVDNCLKVENQLGHQVCMICGGIITFMSNVTIEELRSIMVLADNINLIIDNTIEE